MADEIQETQMVTISDGGDEPKKNRRKRGKGRILLVILFLCALCVTLYSGWQVYATLAERKEGKDAYDEISANVNPVTGDDAAIDTRIQIEINFEELSEINPDIIGWLIQDTSVINYPIVQHTDNEYYLNHLFTGEWNHTGCVFTDKDAEPDFSDRNTPLFAHGRKDGTMFGTLEKYESQAYYDEHPMFILVTKDEHVYKVEPFAGSINDATIPFLKAEFTDDQDFAEYVTYWLTKSTFQSQNKVRTDDKMITMLTCSDDFQNARYALFCTMRPADDEYVVVKKKSE